MSFDSEYQELRKKRKKQEENAENQLIISDVPIKTITGKNDIAPVDFKPRLTTSLPTVNIDVETEDNRTWFQRSKYFDDGYDFGDVTKTILGTLGDVGVNLVGSIGDISEGLLNAGATVVGNVAGIFGNDELKKETEYFIKEDKLDNDVGDLVEMLTGLNLDEKSVLGEKSDALVQSAGQLGATAALSMTGVPWWLTTGLTSFGGETANALNQGATLEEATISGLVTAGAEILTEKISGGIKFGGKTLDDALTKTLAANISKKVTRTLAKFGMDTVFEGAEEVLSGVMSAIGQKLTYADDKELNELFSSEDAWESFIGGAILGGFSSAGNAVKSNVTGVDALSGLTNNEKAVFDKVYKDTIAEREKGGEKLTAKEKTKIYDDVLNKLEKGYISTDTIESVLGGDTYKQYQTEIDNEKALQDEFNTLNKMKQGEMTGEQQDRRNELKEQLKAIKEGTTISDLKSKLSTEVSELAKNSRLAESYNEKSRKGKAFEADLSKYDEKQRSAVKRAIDSGILNNTNRTHEFVDLIAKLEADKGVLFDFTNNEKLKSSMFAIEGKEVAGYVQGKNIAINIDSTKALNTVVGHEITHIFEGTELYPVLQDVVKVFAESKGEYNSKLQSISKLYEGIEDANIENELTAELVGEYLFSDTDFIKNLSAEQPGLFQKVYDEVKYLCKVATTGSKELRQLEKVKKTFAEVYRQKNNTVTDNGVKYSLNANFQSEYDSWDKKDPRVVFNVGETSKVLQKLGVRKQKITWDSKKIIKIKSEHTEMSDEVIKQVPYIIDNPIIVMESQTVNGRLTMFGEVYVDDKPILAVLELNPSGRNGIALDEIKIASAYSKDNAQRFINNSKILFVDENKKRVRNWEMRTRLQLPVGTSTSNSNNSISNSAENVKEVFGYKINQDADVNEDLLEDMSYYHPDAEVDTQGNITVYHRTTKANAEKIKQTGVMTAKEDALFFSSKENGYASDYGDTVVKMKIPSTELRLNDVFDGEVHFDLPLKYKNGGYSLDVSKYIVDDTKFSLVDGSTDIAPEMNNNIYGEDIKLEIDDVPIKETTSAETTENNKIEVPDITVDDMEFTVLDDTSAPAESNEKSNDFFDEKAVTKLTTKVLDKLGIGKSRANRKAVGNLVKSFATNSISSREELYSAVSEKFGTQYVKELNDERVDAKAYLQDVKINIPDSVKSEFGSKKDYDSWKKRIFGKIQITDKGAEIDQVYEELNEMYPHLFPDNIWNEADRLMQISDVLSRPKADIIQYELDSELLNDATDYIIDSVTEFRDVIEKVSETSQKIESADISDEIKKQMNDDLLVAYEKIDNDFNFDKENLVAELKARKSILISDTSNKSAYIKKNANELYTESTQMEKGKRATPELGLLLDTIKASYPDLTKNEIYRTLRTTLLNIRNRPDSMVNVNSEIEKFARELINDNFDSAVEELKNFDNISNEELSKLEEKAEERRYNVRLAVKGKLVKEIMDAEQVSMMGDTSNWKDKKLGLQYKTETEKRNFFDIVRDKNGKKDTKTAQALYDYFMGTYNHNEAELKREAAVIQKKFADLKLNKYEDVFVQMKGEFLHNPHTELTQHDIDTFLKLHGKKINESKVDNAIDMARETYDSLIERMNEVLVAHGMKPIEYRKGYFPHFSEVEKTKWQKIAEKFLNWKTRNDDIPTDIAGMTESFKPNRSWQSFNKQRIGDETDYSFMKGFDGYLQGSLDWIYHIDDIMKRRVFENRIRYDHSDEGVQKQIQDIYKNNEFDTNAKQEQIDLVFSKAKNSLNNFIIDFRTRTNTLAGKKSSMDRGMEEFTNRKFYSTVTNISNRVTGNMVAGSISSALTNFIPITQSWGEVSPKSSLRAMRETIKSTFKDDGIINKSDFLTNRLKNVEKLYQTGWDKANKAAGWLMEVVDSFTSQTVWRSKYLENMSKGMSEAEAIKNADEFAEGLIAGRSRGNMPTIFDSKNLLHKTFTAFQLEVNNQYRYMLKDMPKELKNKSIKNLIKCYGTMFIGAYAYNAVYSALTGRDAAFDPFGIFEDLLRDLGWLGDDEEEPKDIIMNLTDNIIDELPFVGGILGDGGRVPLSSALPYGGIREAYEGIITDFSERDWKNLTEEWLFSVGAYVLSPTAGGQIKKTIQGLSMFDDDLPIAGSYTDSGNLRFTIDETMGEMVRAGLFGQYANKNARDYFDNNRASLKDKQIQELIDLDIPIQDYWEIREGLSDLGPYAKLNEKGDYIGNLDLPVEKKNILINNVADRDTPIDLRGFENYDDFEEFDFATRYPEKYAVLQEQGISVKEYKEKYEETAFIYTDDFSWAANNPDGYVLSKAVTDDVMTYKQYTSDLNSIESDKDRNGNSISGSKKKKKEAYINNLDIDYGPKLILFKSQYKSDDTYNYEIVEYLNSREDITRDEIITILKELDFTVYDDGTVKW